ncbi:hypothetical protein ACFLZ2_00395 [Candidatus Margulisiibacteriota bacterium]
MKKALLVLIILSFMSLQVFAAELSIGTRVSYFMPPEAGASSTLMLGIDADYNLGPHFLAQLAVENANYTAGGSQYSLTPITLTLMGYPAPGAPLEPYIGGGIGYYDKKIDGVSASTTGIHAVAGIALNMLTFIAGFEIKYTIPDIKDGSINYTSVSANMTGGMYMKL